MSVTRVARNIGTTLEVFLYVGETLTDPDANNLTFTVLKADGTTLSTGTATRVSTGRYSLTLAPQSTLNRLTINWVGAFGGVSDTIQTFAEIVGGFYASAAEIRTMNGLSSTTIFTTDEIVAARTWAEDRIERFCDVAFVRRYQRDTLDGNSSVLIDVNRHRPVTILAASVDSVAISDLTVLKPRPRGSVYYTSGVWNWGNQNVVIAYEHGYDRPDEDILQVFMGMVRRKLLADNSGTAAALTSRTTPEGEERIFVPGPGRPTGVPEWDEILNDHRFTEVL